MKCMATTRAIERYLQAQSRTETLTRYYSYPLIKREDQAHTDGTATVVSYFLQPGYEYSLHEKKNNVLALKCTERITACQLFSQRDLDPMTMHEAIRFSYLLDLASCTKIIGMSMAIYHCTHASIHHNNSYLIVAPRYPWDIKSKLAVQEL